MRIFLQKLMMWMIPPLTREEKMTPWERLLILLLFLLGLSLFLYLTGYWNFRSEPFFSNHIGLFCPGCGGSRALLYLLEGQLYMAWRYNALFVFLLPLLLYGGMSLFRSLLTGYPLTRIYIPPVLLWLHLTIIMLFTLLRNVPVPALSFLRPPL